MKENHFRISHGVVRVAALGTILELVFAAMSDVYFPSYSRVAVNGRVGTILGIWMMAAPLALPLYVAFEAWWMRKSEAAMRGLWVDAILAITCFLSLASLVWYAWGHYAMF